MYCVIKCVQKEARVKKANLRHPSFTVVTQKRTKRKSASPVRNVLIFLCLLHVSNWRVRLEEDGCMIRYSTECCTRSLECRRACIEHTLLPTRLLTVMHVKHTIPSLVASSPLCDQMLVQIKCINVRRNATVFQTVEEVNYMFRPFSG
jgi:hypothetical protein